MPDHPPDTVKLGRLATDIGFLLRLAQVKVYERYFRECGEHRIKPGEFSVLWAISNNPGIRQSLLCQRLIIKRSHMTKLARALEEQGFVTRTVPEDDRRGIELTLTARGQKIVDEVATWFFRFEDALGADMGKREREQFTASLLKFIASEENGA